jgi:DNA-binding transcriptional MocR family regulator
VTGPTTTSKVELGGPDVDEMYMTGPRDVVVNKAEEWHYYTIERDGIQRRTTQLRQYYSGGVGTNIYFNDDMPESDEKDYESPVFEEALPSSTNNTDKRPVYEPIDYTDNDIASEEEVPLPRSQRAPKWFPEGQWTRSVAKMANVNKANMSDTEPCVVLTRQIIVGRIKKNPSPPLSRTKNVRSRTPMTADQRPLKALYVWRVKKGK